MEATTLEQPGKTLSTLPGDDVRSILWRFDDRFDLKMLVQAARGVARGPVARLVAQGERGTHEWTQEKNELLRAFDEAGLTAAFMSPEHGGFIEGPKNLALALIVLELSWVDGGAATCCMAGNLALAPIHECGTPEQRDFYLRGACPGQSEKTLRGAFALTEPIPYVGVETGMLGGKMRIAEWREGEEPLLKIDKRGRFITNMGFANFVTAAVDSCDARIKGSAMVILHEEDPGIYDRGTATKKLVHQLSSTTDPIFSQTVKASRIIGGYTVKDGVIIPNFSHSEVIEAVFKRTRVTVGLMTAAKLLSSVEPIIRYHRGRFRGGEASSGTPRHDLGLQTKEDVLHRLVDLWATGEAAASLGFEAARLFDDLDPLEKEKNKQFTEQGIAKGRAQFKALMAIEKDAIKLFDGSILSDSEKERLESDPLIQFAIKDSLANVLCPATKLWNTGHGANMLREAVSLMGGYGITEDCPGFLPFKWMDAQLEATYEGPEAVQRRQLSLTMTNELFLAQFKSWIIQLRDFSFKRPGTGACALSTAMQIWLWTLHHLQTTSEEGKKLYQSSRQGVSFPLTDALSWLLAARYQFFDVLELEKRGPENPALTEGLDGTVGFLTDIAHVQIGNAAGEVGRICAELVYGYIHHPSWSTDGCKAHHLFDDLAALDRMIDEKRSEGAAKPCACFEGLTQFNRLRLQLDTCLTGIRVAKDRAAEALTRVMVPEALDYPL
jgi:alkylation response protein AidB-like acyl-CoA dehydrogenase